MYTYNREARDGRVLSDQLNKVKVYLSYMEFEELMETDVRI